MNKIPGLAAALILIACQGKSPEKNSIRESKTDHIEIPRISDFPTGEPNTAYAVYFSGKSWLAPLNFMIDTLQVAISNVTFEPGCRNNWHTHTGGQILIAVGGSGYYQERGKQAIRMEPGNVIEIPPDVEHWHGAAPDSWFSHLAVACNPQSNRNVWLEPVTDHHYNRTVNSDYP